MFERCGHEAYSLTCSAQQIEDVQTSINSELRLIAADSLRSTKGIDIHLFGMATPDEVRHLSPPGESHLHNYANFYSSFQKLKGLPSVGAFVNATS